MPPLPLADWRAEQLRLTAFPVVGATARSIAWWEQAAGFPAEESSSNAKRGSSLVAGPFGPGKLVLRLEPERIDWLYVPQDLDADALPAEPEFPNIGPVAEMLAAFSGVAEAWLALNDVPDLGRLAFGAVLRHDEPDRRAGYLRLPDYVPVHVDPDSSDFLYQINLPLASRSIEGLEINRLSKWSVAAFKLLALRLTGVGATPHPVVTPEPIYALSVELDINTAPSFERPLHKERLVEVYRELARLGQQVVSEGVAGR